MFTVNTCLYFLLSHYWYYRPNFLLMFDEPTNHLDLETVEALAKAFAKFKVNRNSPDGENKYVGANQVSAFSSNPRNIPHLHMCYALMNIPKDLKQ